MPSSRKTIRRSRARSDSHGSADPTFRIDSTERFDPIPFRFTGPQLAQIETLISTLGLSRRVLLNVAIRYAVLEAERTRRPIFKLRGYPKALGPHELKEELTADTYSRVKDVQALELRPTAALGIALLHKRLLPAKRPRKE